MRHHYIIRLEYLGFRYSGWQIQPGQKTVEAMVKKTLKFVLPGQNTRILASGRTDAKVSALDAAMSVYLEGLPIADEKGFLQVFNKNLPPDIRAMDITLVADSFNVIKDCSEKEYTYLFSFGEKNHPFCAPYMANIIEPLDIDHMIKTAGVFTGTHDFRSFTVKQDSGKNTIRTVTHCSIERNEQWAANFFPESSYLFRIRAEGFMRYQVRMIMGTLIELGRGRTEPEEIIDSLKVGSDKQWSYVAPGSGLSLNLVEFR